MPEKIPIQQSVAAQVAFDHAKRGGKELGGTPGLILALEQMLGGVAPSRQSPDYWKESRDAYEKVYTLTPDPKAASTGIVPNYPAADMKEGAENMLKYAMVKTQSQDPRILRKYLTDLLTQHNLLK